MNTLNTFEKVSEQELSLMVGGDKGSYNHGLIFGMIIRGSLGLYPFLKK